MDIFEVFRISFKAILNNKVRSSLTMLGIIIGVTSVILLVSIGKGLQNYITGEFNSLGSNLIMVLPGKVEFSASGGAPAFSSSKLDQKALDLILKSDSVESADGVFFGPGVLKYRNKKIYVSQILGTNSEFLDIMGLKVETGRFFNQAQYKNSSRVVLLGNQAAIDLFGENVSPIGKQISVEGRIYTVIGIQEKRGSSGFGGNDDSVAYIPATTYQKQFGSRNFGEIVLRSKEEVSPDRVKAEIKRVLGRRLDSENDFSVFTQEQLLTSINSILGALTAALGGIAAISLLVGGIGIMNIMLVSVTERTREIGLRKAVGAKPTDILLQFMLEAVALSLLGGGLGILLGFAGSLVVSNFIKTSVTFDAVALAFGVSAAIGVIFGTAPAISASRKDPIVALRYE